MITFGLVFLAGAGLLYLFIWTMNREANNTLLEFTKRFPDKCPICELDRFAKREGISSKSTPHTCSGPSPRYQAGLCPYKQCVYDMDDCCYECGYHKGDEPEPGRLSIAIAKEPGQLSIPKMTGGLSVTVGPNISPFKKAGTGSK